MIGGIITGVLVLLVLVWAIPTMIIITQQKRVSIIETFGKYSSYRTPGLGFKLPYPIQSVANVIETNLQQINTELGLKTKDNLFITYPISVQYYVSDPVKATYELDDPIEQIKSYISNIIRTQVSQRDFLDLYDDKTEIQREVVETLAEKMSSYGFEIKDVLVDEPIPTQEVQKSFNDVTASKRKKEAAENEAQAERIRIVGEAEAYAESKKLQGEGLANQRDALAEGMKEALQKICDGTDLSVRDAMMLMIQTNKYDALVEASKNPASVIFSDVTGDSESKQYLNYLASSKAFDKDVLGDKAKRS